MKKSVLLYLIFVLLTGTSIAQAQPPRQGDGQSANGIDLVIAIDNSGSMYRGAATRTQLDTVDLGLRVVNDNTLLTAFNEPTDPDGIRYEVTQFVLDWFADFSDRQVESGANFENYASVVGFSDNADVLLPWTRLNEPLPGSDVAPFDPADIEIPPAPTDVANSGYIGLYDQINALFAARPGSNRQRVVVIITDSLPCDPTRTITIEGQGEGRDATCASERIYLPRHLELSGELRVSDVEYNLIFVVDPSLEALYSQYNWENIASSTPTYTGVNGIYGISRNIIELLLDKSAQVLGVDRSNFGTFLNADNELRVPPYQNLAEMTLLTTGEGTGTSNFVFTQPNDATAQPDETLYNSRSGAYRRVAFNSPFPGLWTIEATNTAPIYALATFEPAAATFISTTESVDMFGEVPLYYQIGEDSRSRDTQYDVTVSVEVRAPDAEPATVTLEPTSDGLGWAGSFVPTVAGDYQLTVSAVPDANWAEQLVDDAFLTPTDRTRRVQVSDVTIDASIAAYVPDPGSSPTNYEPGDDLFITNAQTIEVKLSQSNDRPFDDRFSAELVFFPPTDEEAESACLDGPIELEPTPDDLQLTTGRVPFTTVGECQIGLVVRFEDNLVLATASSNDPVIIFQQDDFLNLVVENTRILSFEIRNADGENINDAEVTFDDRESIPEFFTGEGLLGAVYWPYTETRIQVAMVDQEGNPRFPEFATEPEDTIPFSFVLLDSEDETDLSEELGITLQRSDNPGIYVATISNLAPGNYTVRIELDDTIALSRVNQYAPDILDPDGTNARVAFIKVNDSTSDDISRYLIGAVLVVLFGFSFIYFLLRYLRGRNPLRNHLVVYESTPYSDEPKPVWHFPFNELKPRRNDYSIPMSDLPIWQPAIIELDARTGGQGDGYAIIATVRISDSQSQSLRKVVLQKQRIQLDKEPLQLYQDASGRIYFIALRKQPPRGE